MTSLVKDNINKLNDLVNQKAQEWKTLFQEQINSLVKELGEKDERLQLEKIRFCKLKDDFEYNLNLLAERDKELQHYDNIFHQLKANENLRNAEVSEMKIGLDEAQTKYNHLQKEVSLNEKHYQKRLQEYQDEMSKFYEKKEKEIEKEKQEYEKLKQQLLEQIRDNKEDACFERQKIINEFNDKEKQKDMEVRCMLDKKDSEIHSLLLKIKMLTKEALLTQMITLKNDEDLENNRTDITQLQKSVQEKDWDLQDLKNMHAFKLQEMEAKIAELVKNANRKEEDLLRKCADHKKMSVECTKMLENMKLSYNENDGKKNDKINALNKKIEEQELVIKRLHWNMTDQNKAKDLEIHKLQQNINELKMKTKYEMEQLNKKSVLKQLELESLLTVEDNLKMDLNKVKMEVDKYKQDLSLAVEREQILENAKVQLEWEWRQRFERKESDLYREQEDLVKKLTKHKEMAQAEANAANNKLNHQDHLIKMLQLDKFNALKCLEENGIDPDKIIKNSDVSFQDIDEVHKQNEKLKDTIKQMRSDMELLTFQANRLSTPDEKLSEPGYIADMENQVKDLKKKNRLLLNKIDDLTKENKPPSGKQSPKLNDYAVKNHINQLNSAIGVLRNDKVLLTAIIKKKDAHISYLKERPEQSKQRSDAHLESFQYGVLSDAKIKQQSMLFMRKQIEELQLQLQQSRAEAEIYYKSIVEQNLDITQVNNKLSEVKLQQAFDGNHVDQQKQPSQENEPKAYGDVKKKLDLALVKIKELSKNKAQLINVGNRLRAEITQFKGEFSKDNVHSLHGEEYQHEVESKLNKEFIESNPTSPSTDEDQEQLFQLKLPTGSNATQDPGESNDPNKLISPDLSMHTSSEHSSIKEIWKLLEDEETISIPSSIQDAHQNNNDGIVIIGNQAMVRQRQPIRKNYTSKNLRQPKTKQKIRNYNIKDD